MTLQRWARGRHYRAQRQRDINQAAWDRNLYRNSAARTIQSRHRGNSGRHMLRIRHKAATTIQKVRLFPPKM